MSMTDAVALALAHYRATTTTGIQFATAGSWWPILNPDGTPEPDDRAIELSAAAFVLAHIVQAVLDDPGWWRTIVAGITDSVAVATIRQGVEDAVNGMREV